MNETLTPLKPWLITALCLVFSGWVAAAQEQPTTDPVIKKLGLGSGFGNCETNTGTLDRVHAEALTGDGKASVVIAIARLGRGELTGELNRRRLYTVQEYLTARGLRPERIITAEGERVSGHGRVDFYVSGKLFEALVADRCKDLPVGSCIEDFYVEPYYLPRRGKVRWCR